jgi:CheY-like chemotaxis protein
VDDEQMILDVGQAMLVRLGYRVIAAKGGSRAIDIIQRQSKGIDLVIIDMIMPAMDGGVTFDRIRELAPDMPVLLSSGYSINGQARKIIDRGCNGFIQKPFDINELSQAIRRILDEG